MAPRYAAAARPRQRLLLLAVIGGLADGANASFWGSGSEQTATTPWDQPCVDLAAECQELADAGWCATKPEKMGGCCRACREVEAELAEDDLLGCSPQMMRTLKTLEANIQKECLQSTDGLFMHTECTTAAKSHCKNALDLLTQHAIMDEGKACNTYMFKFYPDVAVYWGACATQTPVEAVEVRTAQALSDALGNSEHPPITVFGDVDYTGYYDRSRDVDPFDDAAIRVGWGSPVQISGSAGSLVRATLTARFFVFYGTLSLRTLRLVEPPFDANAEPPNGALMWQRGGHITIRDCVIQTPSPYVYGSAILTSFGEILVRTTNVVTPLFEAKKAGVDSCTRPPNTPALGDGECIMPIDELRISDAEFIATGASPMLRSCPGGSELDSATLKCVYGADAVTTECKPGSKPKVDPVSGKQIPGHCEILTVECPSGSTISSDMKKCIRRVVESPVSEAGAAGSECPEGSERQGETCVYTNLVCQAGSSLKRDADGKEFCVIDTEPECPDGASLITAAEADGVEAVLCRWDAAECPAGSTAGADGTCIKDEALCACPQCNAPPAPPAPPVAVCPAGSERVGDSCLISALHCPDGAELDSQSGVCVQENVQFRTTFDGSSELFPCKLGLLDALIAQGFLVSFMRSLQGILPGCGIYGDRICVALFSVATWNLLLFLWRFCKCDKRCNCKRGRSKPLHKPHLQTGDHHHTTFPHRLEPGWPLEPPYRPLAPTRGMLIITKISCHDLIAADPNGKSDPYVQLKLSDREGHNERVNAQEQQTQVEYKNLHPVFNERFQFHINSSTVLPDLDLELKDKDRATFDDYLGQVKINLHSFFDSHGDWTYTQPSTTVSFELDDPKGLVGEDHMRERLELLHQRGDIDTAPQLGTVTVTMEYVPQRARSPSPRVYENGRSPRSLSDTRYGGSTSMRHGVSPGRPLSARRNRHSGRLEAEADAAEQRRRRTSRSRSPRSARARSNSRNASVYVAESEDELAWREEAADALNGEWTAVGGEDEDHVELQLQQDLSITGRPIGQAADPATIRDGVLYPPRRTRGNGAVEAGPGSPGWKGFLQLRQRDNVGPVELGTVSFVQVFDDGEETTWTAELHSSDHTGSPPYMEGAWSGACEGVFRAHKRTSGSSRRRLSGGGIGGMSTVYPTSPARTLLPRTPSMRLSPTRGGVGGMVDGYGLGKGTLHVKLLRATRLITADKTGAIANCYGKLQLVDSSGSPQSELKKTPTRTNERDPQFDYLCDFHIEGAGSPSSRLAGAPKLTVTMMDKGMISDSFLGEALIDVSEVFANVPGLSDTIEDDFELEDPGQKVNKDDFERRKAEIEEETYRLQQQSYGQGSQSHDNPYGYVRLKLTFTRDEV
jgi:hypothetical protein